ncbi:hypothetical protein FJTKL_08846 [Diaporthe vaccinii]|uniref:Uncharacterized protein n=1 Tax=Diaporthe vaccinii TaxID=105482 RepID=A0ABR4EPS1_9PEZI
MHMCPMGCNHKRRHSNPSVPKRDLSPPAMNAHDKKGEPEPLGRGRGDRTPDAPIRAQIWPRASVFYGGSWCASGTPPRCSGGSATLHTWTNPAFWSLLRRLRSIVQQCFVVVIVVLSVT